MTATAIDALTAVLGARWNAATNKFTDLIKVLPAEKFALEPIKGTRSCDGVLRHVAFWNRYVADSLQGKKPDDSANELSHAAYPDQASLLEELAMSNREIANRLTNTLNAPSLEVVAMALEHMCEHYGQLAVYARLMGIVPPASRV